jgi:chemotaxis signal transduction protein
MTSSAESPLRGLHESSEVDLDAIFARRAEELARVPVAAEKSGTPHLVFEIESQAFALTLDAVAVVVSVDQMGRLPFAKSALDGVILVQGKLVSVLDLSLVGGGKRATGRFVVVLSGSDRLGLRADDVRGIVDIDAARLIHPRENVHGLDSLLSGITQDHVQVLDVPRMLTRKLR